MTDAQFMWMRAGSSGWGTAGTCSHPPPPLPGAAAAPRAAPAPEPSCPTAMHCWPCRLVGRAAHELGEFSQAELAFRRALGVTPDGLPAWAGLARLAAATGNTAAAIEANEKAVSWWRGPAYNDSCQQRRMPACSQPCGPLALLGFPAASPSS